MRRQLGLEWRQTASRVVLIGLIGGMSGACGADMARFSEPFSNPFATAQAPEGTEPEPTRTGSIAVPTGSVESRPVAAPRVAVVPAAPLGPAAAPRQAVVNVGSGGWTAEGGTTVTVGQGDSLANLSDRYGVPTSAILTANGLSAASQVGPGRRIVIPVYNAAGAPQRTRVASLEPIVPVKPAIRLVETSKPAPASPEDAKPRVRPGQAKADAIKPVVAKPEPVKPQVKLLAKAAEPAKPVKAEVAKVVRTEPLKAAKAEPVKTAKVEPVARETIKAARVEQPAAKAESVKTAKVEPLPPAKAEPRAAKPGPVRIIKIEPPAPAPVKVAKVEAPAPQPVKVAKVETPAPQPAKIAKVEAPAAQPVAAKPVAEPAKPAAAKEPEQTASAPVAAAPAAAAPAATPSAEFRWPARGRVITGFGAGGGNEGINIAVPEGTPVKSAESGTVAYAGSEVKGYGNLVLIRHDNGYVSAYAHNGEVKVKRGEKVGRGQVIAKSGQTGNVTSPQLHFEIRKGSTPVDPITHLASQ